MNETGCFFVSDLHGHKSRYETLFYLIKKEKPMAVFLGGDLLPGILHAFTDTKEQDCFIGDYLLPSLESLKESLAAAYPEIFVILGNDDAKSEEKIILEGEQAGLWKYVHNKKVSFGEYSVYGYANIPPSPILLKDWERYDVSRYVDPGCVSPEEGFRSIEVEPGEIKYGSIKKDLSNLVSDDDVSQGIFLFHTPPYNCALDRADLDGKSIDHVPLDVHVGSIAVKEFIEEKQPLLTLHGHIHESYRITGKWREQFNRTSSFTAAHDGKELALVRFSPSALTNAEREHI